MMHYKPYLTVKRLVITKGNKIVYDEAFNSGVNIIRGTNSSGKSTIADFIFYGLGGDLTKLKNEARMCEFVFTEVDLSGNLFTLKRAIKEGGRKGMDIFAGAYEESRFASVTEWIRYPYNADTKESFYQAIFKELEIPYSKSDDKNSLTMHQLLRMMYVDQMTSPDRLFKFDRFDSPVKRQAIGELLLGIADFSLYEKRVNLQQMEGQLDSRIKEIKTIHSFLGSTIKTKDEIDKEIEEKLLEIESLETDIANYTSPDSGSESQAEEAIIEGLLTEVQKIREEHVRTRENIAKISFEINDSQEFIKSLNARIKALRETRNTISALSDVAFIHCPACQLEIIQKGNGCSVCGSEKVLHTGDVDPTFKVRKELEFQIYESFKLIEIKQKKLDQLKVKLSQVGVTLRELEKELDKIRRPQTTINIELSTKLRSIGALKDSVNYLNKSKENFSKLYALYDERDALQEKVTNLRSDIELAQARLENELIRKKNRLSEITLEILRADKEHEEIFNEGKFVEFDFAEDRVSIDERALFSASSMVYLKNAFRLAILRASCEDASFLYPRFLLMDNIEDKGMKEVRSYIFQREIIKISRSLNVNHQIIFTTSMIAPELDGSAYCVGEFYSKQNKTLKL